jgi:transposase InsO family protein
MEEVHIDTLSMGVKDKFGNEHILVVIDSCSRWIEMYPIADLTAQTAARRLMEHFGRYGQPFEIRSDNGTQFCNETVAELLTYAGVEHITTTPYSHEENGLVERANKEVLRHLRGIMFDENIHSDWGQALPIVQRILNSAQ